MTKKINVNLILGLLIIMTIGAIIFFSLHKEEDIYEFKPDQSKLRDYKINEVIPVYVTDEDIAKKYLTEYVNMMLFNSKDAYSLLDEESLKKYSTLKSFISYVNKISKNTEFSKIKIKKYNIETDKENKRIFYIIDTADNIFIFKEETLMNYKVTLK